MKNGISCSVTVAAPTAYELLNDAERELFDYMTGTMLGAFIMPLRCAFGRYIMIPPAVIRYRA